MAFHLGANDQKPASVLNVTRNVQGQGNAGWAVVASGRLRTADWNMGATLRVHTKRGHNLNAHKFIGADGGNLHSSGKWGGWSLQNNKANGIGRFPCPDWTPVRVTSRLLMVLWCKATMPLGRLPLKRRQKPQAMCSQSTDTLAYRRIGKHLTIDDLNNIQTPRRKPRGFFVG